MLIILVLYCPTNAQGAISLRLDKVTILTSVTYIVIWSYRYWGCIFVPSCYACGSCTGQSETLPIARSTGNVCLQNQHL